MKRFLSMRLLGVMAIAAIALSNVILSACSEDDDLEMNSSTLAKGLMTRSGENGVSVHPALATQYYEKGDTVISIVEYVKQVQYNVVFSAHWESGYSFEQHVSVSCTIMKGEEKANGEAWVTYNMMCYEGAQINYCGHVYINGKEEGIMGTVIIPMKKATPPDANAGNDSNDEENNEDTGINEDNNKIIKVEHYVEQGIAMVTLYFMNGTSRTMTEEEYIRNY